MKFLSKKKKREQKINWKGVKFFHASSEANKVQEI